MMTASILPHSLSDEEGMEREPMIHHLSTSPSSREKRHSTGFQRLFFFPILALVVFILILTIRSNPEREGGESLNKLSNLGSMATQQTKRPIRDISILGERNSGTTWMTKEMKRCFNQTLRVHVRLTRHKHWFQHDDGQEHNQTVVVASFRNPYHWVAAMMDKPRHTPVHRHLDWKTYITKPWTMKREASDYDLLEKKKNKNATAVDGICQQGFNFDDVVCCNYHPYEEEYIYDKRQRRPFYEMKPDGSGIPYGSVLQMRADKIRDHITVDRFDFVSNVFVVRYEEMVRKGTADLIRSIEKAAGVSAHCEPAPPQANRTQRYVDPEMVEYMNKHVNWDAEALIGYEKW